MPEGAFYHISVRNKKKGDRVRTIVIDKKRDIKAIYAANRKVILTYLVPKSAMSRDEARKWTQRHKSFNTTDSVPDTGFRFMIPVIKATQEGAQWFIEGVASSDSIDSEDERMTFKSLQDMVVFTQRGGVILDNEHSPRWDDELGRVVAAKITPKGQFWVRTALDMDNPKSVYLVKALQKGKQLGMSVWGYARKAFITKEGGRDVRNLDGFILTRIAVTTRPINPDTWVQAVAKSVIWPTEVQMEENMPAEKIIIEEAGGDEVLEVAPTEEIEEIPQGEVIADVSDIPDTTNAAATDGSAEMDVAPVIEAAPESEIIVKGVEEEDVVEGGEEGEMVGKAAAGSATDISQQIGAALTANYGEYAYVIDFFPNDKEVVFRAERKLWRTPYKITKNGATLGDREEVVIQYTVKGEGGDPSMDEIMAHLRHVGIKPELLESKKAVSLLDGLTDEVIANETMLALVMKAMEGMVEAEQVQAQILADAVPADDEPTEPVSEVVTDGAPDVAPDAALDAAPDATPEAVLDAQLTDEAVPTAVTPPTVVSRVLRSFGDIMKLDVQAGQPTATLMDSIRRATAEAAADVVSSEVSPTVDVMPLTPSATPTESAPVQDVVATFDTLIRATLIASMPTEVKKARLQSIVDEMGQALDTAVDAAMSPIERVTKAVIEAVEQAVIPVIEQQSLTIKALQQKIADGVATVPDSATRKTLLVQPSRIIRAQKAQTFTDLVTE